MLPCTFLPLDLITTLVQDVRAVGPEGTWQLHREPHGVPLIVWYGHSRNSICGGSRHGTGPTGANMRPMEAERIEMAQAGVEFERPRMVHADSAGMGFPWQSGTCTR